VSEFVSDVFDSVLLQATNEMVAAASRKNFFIQINFVFESRCRQCCLDMFPHRFDYTCMIKISMPEKGYGCWNSLNKALVCCQ
jgi:hypothetical protein